MAEQCTLIELIGSDWPGFVERGTSTVEIMVAEARRQAAWLREQADQLDAAEDEDFRVRVIRGVEAMRPVRTLQEGRDDAHPLSDNLDPEGE